MAVAFRSEGHATAGSGANTTPPEPAGAAAGDFFLGLVICGASAASLTRPSGWTNLANGLSAGNFRYDLSWILRGGSAPARNWTHTSIYREGYILAFSGTDQTTPIDASTMGTTGTLNNPNPPAATAVGSDDMSVAVGVGWNGSATVWGAPSGYAIRTNNPSGANLDAVMASKLLSASGSEDPAAFSGSTGSSGATWAATVLLKAAAAVTKSLVVPHRSTRNTHLRR